MDPMTLLALGSVLANAFGKMGGGGGATRQQRRLHNQSGDLLSTFLNPGAFDTGGAGQNFFFNNGPLQRQGIGVDQFLSQPSPEMRAFDTARPILEGMLTGTGPQFERDIAMGNQQGGRFSSGNAIMRGEALRNLFNMRTQTAGTLGALAGQAGSSQFDRLMQAQAQRLQLLVGLFGMGGQFGQNATQPTNTATTLGRGGMDLMTLLSILGQGKTNLPPGTPTGVTPGIMNV